MKRFTESDNRFVEWRRHAVVTVLSLMITAGTLVAVWVRNDLSADRIRRVWESADKDFLALIMAGSALFHVFVGTDKFWRILRALRVNLSFLEVLRVRLGAGPVRFLTPFKAGEAANVLYFCRCGGMTFGRSAGALAFDRGLNVVGATFWLLAGLAMTQAHGMRQMVRLEQAVETRFSDAAALIVFGLSLGVVYTVFFFLTPMHDRLCRIVTRIHPKLGRFTTGLLAPFRELTGRQKLFFLGYGVLFAARPLIVAYLLFLSFGVFPDPSTFLAYASMVMFAGHVPSTAGVGPREAAMIWLFAGAASVDTLFLVGFLTTCAVHLLPIVIGLPWVPWFVRRVIRGEGAAETKHP